MARMHKSDEKLLVNTHKLEELIDSIGVGSVLEAISEICEEKAEHIESNWQDRVLAKLWQKVGKRIGALSRSTLVRTLP